MPLIAGNLTSKFNISFMTEPKPAYTIVKGPQDLDPDHEEAKDHVKSIIIKACVDDLGVNISKEHIFMFAQITIPRNRTLMMEVPEKLDGIMDIGVFYLPKEIFRVDGKPEDGPALVIIRRTGDPFSRVQITVDSPGDRIASLIAFIPGS